MRVRRNAARRHSKSYGPGPACCRHPRAARGISSWIERILEQETQTHCLRLSCCIAESHSWTNRRQEPCRASHSWRDTVAAQRINLRPRASLPVKRLVVSTLVHGCEIYSQGSQIPGRTRPGRDLREFAVDREKVRSRLQLRGAVSRGIARSRDCTHWKAPWRCFPTSAASALRDASSSRYDASKCEPRWNLFTIGAEFPQIRPDPIRDCRTLVDLRRTRKRGVS